MRRMMLWLMLMVSQSTVAAEGPPDLFAKVVNKPNAGGKVSKSVTSNVAPDNIMSLYHTEISTLTRALGMKLGKKERNVSMASAVAAANDEVASKLSIAAAGKTKNRQELAHRIFKQVALNAVSATSSVINYDRRGDVGFCFGRAAMVHYLLLEAVSPKKTF